MWYTLTLIVGIILIAIAMSILQKTLVFLKSSERAIGTVIELERINGSDGDTFQPVFKFKTRSNEEIIHRHISSSNPPGWKIGETVSIAYDANNPSNARVLTYLGTFLWVVILVAIAMPFIVIGGGYHISQSYLK